MLDCNECIHIDMTEKDQEEYNRIHGWKPYHICLKHNIQLVHLGSRTRLRPYREELIRGGLECYTFEPKKGGQINEL